MSGSRKGSNSNPNNRVRTKAEGRGSASSRKGEKGSEESPDPIQARNKFFICLKCEVGVEEEEESVQCYDCRQWCHKGCSKLTERDFSYLGSSTGTSGIEWICEICKAGKGEKKTEVEAKMDRLIKIFEKVNERLENLENGCSGRALTEKIEEVVEKKVEELWEEKVEKKKRETNLIFTNIPESTEDDGTKRKKEELKNIRDIVGKICPEMKEAVEEPTRLGQYNLGSRPRLVRVKTTTAEAKKEILKNARKLNQGVREQKDRIYINPDYTPAERKRNKELREELRQRIEKGERDIGIRGGKILKVQWKPRPSQGVQEGI